MNPDDREAIIAAVRSYRPNAPVNIEDVRIAAAMDGHSLRHVDSKHIVGVLKKVAVCEPGDCRRAGHWTLIADPGEAARWSPGCCSARTAGWTCTRWKVSAGRAAIADAASLWRPSPLRISRRNLFRTIQEMNHADHRYGDDGAGRSPRGQGP